MLVDDPVEMPNYRGRSIGEKLRFAENRYQIPGKCETHFFKMCRHRLDMADVGGWRLGKELRKAERDAEIVLACQAVRREMTRDSLNVADQRCRGLIEQTYTSDLGFSLLQPRYYLRAARDELANQHLTQ